MSSPTSATLAARLDRLPVGRFHRQVLLALAVVFFFELADLNTFSYVGATLEKNTGMTTGTFAAITSVSFAGMFCGAVFGGRFADAVGRQRALFVSVSFFSLFSLANAAAWDNVTIGIARFLTGVGLSAMTVAATTYISEVMPAALRGRMQAGVIAIGLIGIPAMTFFAKGIAPLSPNSWRWVFVFGAVGLVMLPLIVRLPESPRWLSRHGRVEDAENVVRRIETETAARYGQLPEPAQGVEAEQRTVRYRELLIGPLGRRTVLLIVVWVFQTLGFYGFTAWVPTLLVQHGFDLTKALWFTALTTLGAVPGALLAWPISDRFGRKIPIVVVALAIAVCGLAYGLTFNSVAIVIFGFCVNALVQTFAALLYAYTPELFPTELRNSGNGLTYGTGRLANIFGSLIVAAIFSGFGYQPVFVYIAACWIVVATTVAVFGPRTGMRHLENISTTGLDDQPPHIRKLGVG
ncbi:MAG TPA: MFS transporter [Pseudonocardiaceae bacterium]|jgi:putative MFS transporter|nr:MFS transporter [Pseudonocardiaceae bacterium]